MNLHELKQYIRTIVWTLLKLAFLAHHCFWGFLMLKRIVMVPFYCFPNCNLTYEAKSPGLMPLISGPLPSWGGGPSKVLWIFLSIFRHLCFCGFPGGSAGKDSAHNVEDLSSVPGLGRSPGEGKVYLLQYSGLENPDGQRSLAGYSPWARKESDNTEWLSTAQQSTMYKVTPTRLSFGFSTETAGQKIGMLYVNWIKEVQINMME